MRIVDTCVQVCVPAGVCECVNLSLCVCLNVPLCVVCLLSTVCLLPVAECDYVQIDLYVAAKVHSHVRVLCVHVEHSSVLRAPL